MSSGSILIFIESIAQHGAREICFYGILHWVWLSLCSSQVVFLYRRINSRGGRGDISLFILKIAKARKHRTSHAFETVIFFSLNQKSRRLQLSTCVGLLVCMVHVILTILPSITGVSLQDNMSGSFSAGQSPEIGGILNIDKSHPSICPLRFHMPRFV